MTNNRIIEISGIDVYQQQHLVLSNVSLEIEKGEFVFLIGQTGSGKSSLLKTLYGELRIHSGAARMGDFDLLSLKQKDIPFLRRRIGIVFQDFQLLTDRSIEDNLVFAMKATGWAEKKLIDSRINEVLAEVGLTDKNHKMPHQLSGGEQQRSVIARALINYPEVILADEPTGNLDPDSSIEIMNLLLRINRSGTTILMATHDYRMIEKFPSRIIKCENGLLSEDSYQTK